MKEVVKWLNDHGLFWINIKTTGTWDPTKRVYRESPYTLRGTSDLLVLHQSQPLFIELKAPKGKQSVEQKTFQKMIENEGCEYHVVRSADDLALLFPKTRR